MLMNMKSNSKVGKAITETASIAYTGELLPAGTASYGGISIDATKRYLKNSGKDKTPTLVEAGQGKFFNGTNQFINTGIIPNQAQGTLVSRFTYTSGTDRLVIGQSGGTANFMVGINISGKIYCRLGSVSNIATTWSPISGKSYHVALRYSGGTAELLVDMVSIGTFTIDLSLPSVSLSIGARNTSTTASLYWNSVISETYYYDVALTDTQIETLYRYPEKVKSYNGAIVPDIGSEANCKLFLPMCENAGSNVVNVAVAKGSEGFSDPTCSDSSKWLKGGTTTVENGRLNWFGGTYVSIREQNIPLITGKYYSITWDVVSYTSGQIRPTLVGGTQVSGSVVTAIGTYTQILQATTGNTDVGFQSTNVEFIGSIDNVSVKEITAYPLASYATTMHTSAAKLPYGAQCTAWKRGSLGVLLGMSNGLSFDGGVSVNPIDTGWLPVASNYILEFVGYFVDDGLKQQDAFGVYDGTNNLQWYYQQILRRVQGYHGTTVITNANLASWTYSHLVLEHRASTGKLYAYRNGVLIIETTTAYAGTLLKSLFIGGNNNNGTPASHMTTIMGTPKIHKGTQYAKFNIAKAWANAQKTIAKLGA